MSLAPEAVPEIRPFRVDVAQGELDDLKDRIAKTRWPDELPDAGWAQGVPVSYLQQLAEYWRTGYDWRTQEARLNGLSQFTTTIDGAHVHFIHIRSGEPDALPLLLTHGWPGSVVEFLDIIGPLTDPRSHGADPRDAFHVVIPSLPGFGFSGPTTEGGWDYKRVARAWQQLMSLLGYERYGAQGGDTWALVAAELARIASRHVVGVHANGLFAFHPLNAEETAALTPAERERLAWADYMHWELGGYAAIQTTRPQTLAFALMDSPVGQLAWIVEKFKEWTDPAVELPESAVDRDLLLTNVSIYWFTKTAASSARIYYETAHSGAWSESDASSVPTGVAVFPRDISIRKRVEREHNVVHWSEFERGGHFAAMEAPDLLVGDIRDFFRCLR